MGKEERFNQFYLQLIKENADEIESSRIDAKIAKEEKEKVITDDNVNDTKHNTVFVITIIISIILMLILIYILDTSDYIKSIGTISIVILDAIIVICNNIDYKNKKNKIDYEHKKDINKENEKKKKEEYKAIYKEKAITNMIKCFNENLEFKPNEGIPSNIYKEAEFETYTRYTSEDLIQGQLNDKSQIFMSEVKVEGKTGDVTGIEKPKEVTDEWEEGIFTIFNGMFARIKTPKPFNTCLYIREDRKDRDFLRNACAIKHPFDDMSFKMDSQEFEKKFDVYASDQIVAMQLLTADIMQMMIDFYNNTKIDFDLTIKDNYIYIRFWCGKMFETVKLDEFSLDRETLYKYYQILDFTFELISKLVDLLNETQYN